MMHSNKEDLRMLEDMGISPDRTVREKKPTLKTVGTAVVAMLRMQKMAAAWSENKKIHESLLKKLESMKRSQGQGVRRRVTSGRMGYD